MKRTCALHKRYRPGFERFASYADDGVDLPLGPVDPVIEERHRKRVLDVLRAMHDHFVLQTVIRHSVDRVGARVDPVQPLRVEVERQTVWPATTRHTLDVEKDFAVGAAHARSLDARLRRLPVRPEHESAMGQNNNYAFFL